jgi:hypothetical protein
VTVAPRNLASSSSRSRMRSWVGGALLFGVAMGGTLLLVWPPVGGVGAHGPDIGLSVEQRLVVVQHVPPVSEASTARRADDDLDGITDHIAGMYAEPAVLDLLEDADSADPQVSAEAQRVLREHEMLPAEIPASASTVE